MSGLQEGRGDSQGVSPRQGQTAAARFIYSSSSIHLRRRAAVSASIFDLTGKVALVTGGSQGLGKAMARGLAEAGADVVIASRRESELKAALAEILQGTPRRGRYLVSDLSKR